MMEFVLSRAALMLCGVLLMGAVAIPLADVYGTEADDRLDGLVQRDAETIDDYWGRSFDEMFLRGSSMLPAPGHVLSVDGYKVRLVEPDGSEHTAFLHHPSDPFVLTYDGIVSMHIANGRMVIDGSSET
ncbi:MAG: hypothetical protein MJZ38_02775 [archaeon]|nr:hypothetical protein [archaeon]